MFLVPCSEYAAYVHMQFVGIFSFRPRMLSDCMLEVFDMTILNDNRNIRVISFCVCASINQPRPPSIA